ncbi:mitochondrial import inner membrane translocase subunit Tim29 isoform X1 [Etheostoma spectabile]|uniref:mitochondrial import inner membrane translocase subunit Tim29 isoform X1 n=1 Tax=Etheostoma spectabile TaxID=54343 RepID=UPI0013AF57E5|nr:mitochondrial import inner membrane translocase subunit Tim29 isoform X1 [Etheostoma spectabile]
MASLRVVRRMFCVAAETAAAPVTSSRWQRLKNSKAGAWCRGLVSDYKEACREVVVGSWERPLKASVYATLLGGAWACFYTQPDRSSFDTALLEVSNHLGLLSPWIRNGTSDGHVQSLVKLRNEGRLRHASLGLLSLVYRADYDADATLYEAQCSNLLVPWRELPQRVLDVGFIGRWWLLDSKMKNFDVNEDEFKNLPAHMQATSPPSVQEVERNERLHKESWLALTVEEEEKEVDRKEESVSEESQSQARKEERTQA